mgnify:CR=1 FL=1
MSKNGYSIGYSLTKGKICLFHKHWLKRQKRIKKHEAELNAIIKGTTVVVAGLIGRVVKVIDDKTLKVDFGNGMEVKVLRAYVSQVVFESQPETRKK